MLEMQAAIGRIQLRRMLDWTAKRTVNAQFIWAACRQHAAVRVPAFGCNTRACDTACASRSGCEGQQVKTLLAIQQALEKGGIEFIGTPEDAPGVRLRLNLTADQGNSKPLP